MDVIAPSWGGPPRMAKDAGRAPKSGGHVTVGVRRPLAVECKRLLEKYPFLGPPGLSTLANRMLQEWLEEALVKIARYEATTADNDSEATTADDDFDEDGDGG